MPDEKAIDPKARVQFKVELTPIGEDGKQFSMMLTEGKKAIIKRLNGFEQLAADDYAADTLSGMRASRTYGICMLRRIGDTDVVPLSGPLEFQRLSEQLTARDTVLLATAYNQIETPEEGVALKNEQSAATESI